MPIINSIVNCPKCGHKSTETMPIETYRIVHVCKGCGHRMLTPNNKCSYLLRLRVHPLPVYAGRLGKAARRISMTAQDFCGAILEHCTRYQEGVLRAVAFPFWSCPFVF